MQTAARFGPAQLIRDLSRPSAYPSHDVGVTVEQTHISVVFLVGDDVYKIKKPVALGFLDFSTPELRRHFVEEEVRLNRRLAPDVYRGVVAVTIGGDGRARIGGDGEVVEHAVWMRRLPSSATLLARVRAGTISRDQVARLANCVATFHAAAQRSQAIARGGRYEQVARTCRDVLVQAEPQVGSTVGATLLGRVRDRIEVELSRRRALIEARAAAGMPCDTHGDLHLDHVYELAERPAPDDLVIIDCIEFNDRFRHIDPIADLAFLSMDLAYHGRDDLRRVLDDAYIEASGDDEGRALLPLYVAYRATVRALVEGIKASEIEVPADVAEAARCSALGHWLFALGELEVPERRPCLVLTSGLPGTGKSTLARAVGASCGMAVVRSDAVRKQLAGADVTGLYTNEHSDRTYAECQRRARGVLGDGGRVLVDANFRTEERRRAFLAVANELHVPAVMLVCRSPAAVARRRLAARTGDVSDADWAVYQQLADEWEEPGVVSAGVVREVATGAGETEAVAEALRHLRALGLAKP